MSLEQGNVIDALGVDAASGRVVLVIRHGTAWDGSSAQLYLLQEKLNAYLSFALDGEMESAYPDYIRRPLTVRIDCATEPDQGTLHLLGHVRQQLEFQDIELEVRVGKSIDVEGSPTESHGCGGGCQCHS